VNENLKLLSKIILDLIEIRCQVLIRANMSDQNRIVDFDWLTLLLKAEVWINIVYNPGVVQWVLFCSKRCFLLATHWGIYSWAQWLTGKLQSLAVQILIHLNLDLLSISNNVITTKHVCLFSFADNKYRSCNGSWMVRSGSWNICLVNSKSFCAQVSNNITLYLFVCNDHMIAISKRLIFVGMSPGNLLRLIGNS
jgi:hypothetical protein